MRKILSVFGLSMLSFLFVPSTFAADPQLKAVKESTKAIPSTATDKVSTKALEAKAEARGAMEKPKSSVGQAMRININTANVEELSMLDGVGPSKAQAIVDYRKQHGKFSSIDDLLNVKGIGPKTLDSNRNLLGL
ncbi:MAG: ComEA family DNA-binding protein [Shewanella sp.]|uniref:ComEA family DNA-binding protein n=1 Tax=Shewanella sp. SNU WT4 TaxID=2590015 RepID=UPI00112928AD|nr:helix-hairpin-helix domain-containing protein [Shewanella sp. SNU WT4]QDF66687.1 helix-hairpin-helix domain-containing protein [Shewanella sp. SNU WT4]